MYSTISSLCSIDFAFRLAYLACKVWETFPNASGQLFWIKVQGPIILEFYLPILKKNEAQ